MPLPPEMPEPDEVGSREQLIAFVRGLMNAIYREEQRSNGQASLGGFAHADLNHSMLDGLDGLAAWLEDYFHPDAQSADSPSDRLREPDDPEVWRWVAICLRVAAAYE